MNREALRKLCGEATDGDWFWNSYDGIFAGKGDDSEAVAWVEHLNETDKGDQISGPRRVEAQANARLIAAARTEVPALLDTLEAVEGLIEQERASPLLEGKPKNNAQKAERLRWIRRLDAILEGGER